MDGSISKVIKTCCVGNINDIYVYSKGVLMEVCMEYGIN